MSVCRRPYALEIRAFRDPLDLLRLSFAIGALVFALQGDWDAFVRLLIPGLLVLLIGALDVPRPIDWLFCLAMVFQGWGNALHLFGRTGGTTTPSTSPCPPPSLRFSTSASPAWTS